MIGVIGTTVTTGTEVAVAVGGTAVGGTVVAVAGANVAVGGITVSWDVGGWVSVIC